MKKQLIIALAISLSAFTFAQKKELKAAEKAIKGNNYAEAKAALATVEPMLGNLDAKLKDKYSYLKGLSLYANGSGSNSDIDKALAFFNKAKNSYKAEVNQLNTDIVNKFVTKGNEAYEGKKFDVASEYFEKVYNLREKDTIYLYYAAATAVNVQDYDRALSLYEKLKNLNYDGTEISYHAINKNTKEKETFPSKELRDTAIIAKSHITPTEEEKSPSKRGEIVKNVALIYISQGDNDKAIKAIGDARKQFPDDVNLIISEANIYYKMGDTAKFKELMEKASSIDPDNQEILYNLGVVAADSDQPDEALEYYKKATEIDPNYINAYINSASVILTKASKLVEEMDSLGTSAADDKRYEELRVERQDIYREAIPFLTKVLEIDASNYNAVNVLKDIYSVLGDTDKFKAMKAKLEALDGQ